ncbi:MAG TPA: hypothetical protein VI300_30125 [Solirubrobacter sp.]
MHARVDERAERERPETGRPRRPEPPLHAIVALQRSAGNAAVARSLAAARSRSLQRELRFTDTSATFTAAPAALKYLNDEYVAAYKKPASGKVAERLREVAGAAASTDKIVETTLKPALAYIHDGTPLRPAVYEREPWKSPARDAGPSWNFEMTGGSPAPLFAPQSPRYQYPDTDYDRMSVDVGADMRGEKARVEKERSGREEEGEKLGQNMLTYKVRAEVRVETMRSTREPDGRSRYTTDRGDAPKYMSVSKGSDVYQSKFERPARTHGDDAIDMEASMRAELDRLHPKYKGNRDFYAGSTLYAYDRDSAKKAKRGKESDMVDRSGGYFRDAGSRSISTAYVHSEVQAAAHAHDGAGRALARAIMADIERELRTRKRTGQPLRAVVVALTYSSHSDPNSVCGGACKGALMHIGEILEDTFTTERHAAKPNLSRDDIFLRASREFRVSGHVGSSKKFQRYGAGAGRAPGGGKLPHRRIYEYNPY